jgi:hypothetical protein
MKPEISEFSYGYALVETLTGGAVGLTAAPIFPSLYQEGQPGGGYDAFLPARGLPVFLQFKLCHYMSRSSAKEWDEFGAPYYRFYLHSSGSQCHQHELLLELERDYREVYYAVPKFYTTPELNDAYLNGQIRDRSAFFRPSDIGVLPDHEEHYVVLSSEDQEIYRLCSKKPKSIKKPTSGKEFIEMSRRSVRERSQRIDREFLESMVRNVIFQILEEFPEKFDLERIYETMRGDSTEDSAQMLAYVGRTVFNAQLVILSEH